MAPSVLMIGLKSSAVDFTKWPQLSLESLEQAFASVLADLTAAGFNAHWCLVDADATAAHEQVVDSLRQHRPDIVVIGAGVRKDPDHLLLFEQIVNSILREAPRSRIAFNTLPLDTVEAVQRWARPEAML